MAVSTSQKVTAAFGLLLIPLLVMGWFSYSTPYSYIALSDALQQSQETLERMAAFDTDMRDLETGQRGYMLTGNAAYLEPFLLAKGLIDSRLAELHRGFEGNPSQQQRLANVESLVHHKIHELERTIDVRRTDRNEGFAKALKIIETDVGKQIMDDIRREMADIRREEQQHRDRAQAESTAASRRLIAVASIFAPAAIVCIVISIWLIRRDLAVRARAEAEVKRQRAVLETVLESMGDGVAVSDSQGRSQIFNPMARQLLGRDIGTTPPAGWPAHFGLFLPDGTSVFPVRELPIIQSLCGESADDVEMLVRPSNGGPDRMLNVSGRPIVGHDGHVQGSVVVFHDVTERREFERTLRVSEERFRLLVSSIRDYAIITLDPEGRVTTWNVGAERIKGYRADEIIGENFSRFYPEETVQRGGPQEELQKARTAGHIEDESWRVRKDGSRFWANVILTALWDDQGQLIGFSKITRDLTERKRADEALAANMEMLKRSNRELEQFAYVASHDLKEPLRMVASYTTLLAEEFADKLGPEANTYIGYAVDGARRMQALIDDLLNYARVGRGGGGRMQQVDLQQLAASVLENLEGTVQANGAIVEIDDLPTVTANPTLLAQVIQNLVANAIKFHGEISPIVRITAQSEGDEWKFCVSDNGIGIAPQYRERIFELFQRLHGRGQYEGTGIGLSICRKVMEQHGGRIWVESEPGQGSKFYFTLPREQVLPGEQESQLQEQESVLV